jgi:DNA replication protein DnaC
MYNQQTVEKLRSLKLPALAAEYLRQSEMSAMDALNFDERFALMVDAEWLTRENNRVQRSMREANLRFPNAALADIDYRPSRKLDRAYVARLSDLSWIRHPGARGASGGDAKNLIISGCTGTGKTWLACAFGIEACCRGFRVAFFRVNRLLSDMAAAYAAGEVGKLLTKLKKVELLILDDWGLSSINPLEGRFLLELFEDRYTEHATIFAAQVPVLKWHGLFEDATVADAVLDRIVHNAYRIDLQGPSLRPAVDQVKTPTAPVGAQDQGTHPLRDQ